MISHSDRISTQRTDDSGDTRLNSAGTVNISHTKLTSNGYSGFS